RSPNNTRMRRISADQIRADPPHPRASLLCMASAHSTRGFCRLSSGENGARKGFWRTLGRSVRMGEDRLLTLTFDATLKDMVRDSPRGFLAAFDRPPTGPVKLLNVDLSTVTTTADLILGLGEPVEEIIQLDFQSSAAAWKHADVMVYNALLFAHYRVPVHSVVILLRPEAAHVNLNGVLGYAPRPGRGSMDFRYEVVPLWKRPAEELLAADAGVAPLAMLGRLPEEMSLE